MIINSEVAPLLTWAKANGISRASAYRHIAAGRLKVFKLGARTYLRLSDAAAFIEKCEASSRKGVHHAK